MQNKKCEKCNGEGRYFYDELHIKSCEVCCTHPDGWWKLENNYGEDNGKYACKKGCGTLVDSIPPSVDSTVPQSV